MPYCEGSIQTQWRPDKEVAGLKQIVLETIELSFGMHMYSRVQRCVNYLFWTPYF